MNKLFFITIFLASISTSILAGPLISIQNCSNQAVCDLLLNPILAIFPQVQSGSFGQEMGNAANFSQKGLAADYTDNLNTVSFGGAFGIGASLADQQSSTSNVNNALAFPGIGISASATFGIKADFLPKFFLMPENIYFNFFTYQLPKSTITSAKTTNFGVHLQYTLIPRSSSSNFFSFGNVLFTTGFEYNSLSFSFSGNLQASSGATSFSGSYQLGTESSIVSIPLEVSNNLKILYFLNFFYGVAADINIGSSSPINVSSLLISGGGVTGTPVLDLGGKSTPTLITSRYFYGFQFNIWALKLYLQTNKGITAQLTSSIVGLRVTI